MKKINLKTYFSKRKQRIAVSGVSPRFDWLLILGIGGVLLFIGVGYSIFLYVQVNSGSLFENIEEDVLEVELETKKKSLEEKVKMIEEQTKTQTEIFDESNTN